MKTLIVLALSALVVGLAASGHADVAPVEITEAMICP